MGSRPNAVCGVDPSLRGCGVSSSKEQIIIKTEPSDLETPSGNLLRRCQEIVAKLVIFINQQYKPDDEILVVLEAPVLNAMGGAHHPFECGWLYNDLYRSLPAMLDNKLHIIEVPTSSLRKWATGKGNCPKDQLKLEVFKKFGKEFELDPGSDKLMAWLCYKYGVALLEGAVEHTPMKRRGLKKKKDGQSNKTPAPKKRSSKSASSNAGSSDKPKRRRVQ